MLINNIYHIGKSLYGQVFNVLRQAISLLLQPYGSLKRSKLMRSLARLNSVAFA